MSPNREAMLRIRAQWKADGKCSRCGCDRTDRYLTCAYCRKSRKRRNTHPKAA